MFWRRVAELPESWPSPTWVDQGTPGCLNELHRYVQRQAATELAWYRRNIPRVLRASHWLLLWTIGLTAAGGLVPVLSSMGILDLLQGLRAPLRSRRKASRLALPASCRCRARREIGKSTELVTPALMASPSRSTAARDAP